MLILIFNIWLKIKEITLYHPKKNTLNYILYPKFSKCTINTLNYNPCYIFHTAINSVVIFNDNMWKELIVPLLNSLIFTFKKIHFIILKYALNLSCSSMETSPQIMSIRIAHFTMIYHHWQHSFVFFFSKIVCVGPLGLLCPPNCGRPLNFIQLG